MVIPVGTLCRNDMWLKDGFKRRRYGARFNSGFVLVRRIDGAV